MSAFADADSKAKTSNYLTWSHSRKIVGAALENFARVFAIFVVNARTANVYRRSMWLFPNIMRI